MLSRISELYEFLQYRKLQRVATYEPRGFLAAGMLAQQIGLVKVTHVLLYCLLKLGHPLINHAQLVQYVHRLQELQVPLATDSLY